MWRLGELIRGKDMALVPHCFHTGIALAATLHLLSAQPLNPPGRGRPSPTNRSWNTTRPSTPPARTSCVPSSATKTDTSRYPAAPGLGITVQRDVLARYTTATEMVAAL